jgi:hypothetical protein
MTSAALMELAIVTYGIEADAASAEGKFLQLRVRGREHLLFATKQLDRFHNQILARFLAERRLVHRWADEQTLEFDRDAIAVIGGGRFRLDAAAGTLALWDNSQAYGRFDDRGLTARIRASGHRFARFAVEIA